MIEPVIQKELFGDQRCLDPCSFGSMCFFFSKWQWNNTRCKIPFFNHFEAYGSGALSALMPQCGTRFPSPSSISRTLSLSPNDTLAPLDTSSPSASRSPWGPPFDPSRSLTQVELFSPCLFVMAYFPEPVIFKVHPGCGRSF